MMPIRVWLTCAILAIIGFVICHDDAMGAKHCEPASCGDLHDIRYPFRLKINGTYDPNCHSHPAELSCEQDHTILYLFNCIYYVKDIDYSVSMIRVVDPGLLSDTCPFRPLHHLTSSNFSEEYPYPLENQYKHFGESSLVVFFDCPLPVNSTGYIKINCSSTSSSSSTTFSYIMLGDGLDDLHSCNMTGITMIEETPRVHSFSVILDESRKSCQDHWMESDGTNDSGPYCFSSCLELQTMPTEDIPYDSDETDSEEISILQQISATESTSMV
ncbi:hypothetical protein M0R45_027954 [Rubus argutus]|uniref:Wall-associated receptor kinase galacturonan-binding domain-containing protein n=1 Tax=Rubus argutus TaxID=59490 RepID=A0AAW1W5N8_RUBAR